MHTKVYGRANNILDSAVGADFVALNIQLGKCFGMEEVSAEVWRLLSTPSTLDELCAKLSEAYDVDDNTCRLDVGNLLSEMIEAGLVETQAGSTE